MQAIKSFATTFETRSERYRKNVRSSTNRIEECDRAPVKLLLIDLNGTMTSDNDPCIGALKALKKIRQLKIPVKFVSNTSSVCRRVLHQRLLRAGLDIDEIEIWTSLLAARALIATRNLRPYLLLDDCATEDVEEMIRRKGQYDSVVIGLAREKTNCDKLNEAFQVLMRGCPLITLDTGRMFRHNDGAQLGAGAFVRALEYAANCQAEVIGKPSKAFYSFVLSKVKPENAVMIGDDIENDILGAQSMGIRAILVKTGVYRAGDEDKISPPPKAVCSNVSYAVDFVLKSYQCATT